MTRSDAHKPESDSLPYISVIELGHHGILRNGQSAVVRTMTFGSVIETDIAVFISGNDNSYITCDYRTEYSARRRVEKVLLTTTPCHYGSLRYWLCCPKCQLRVGKLYLLSDLYACRHCHNLTYKSRMRKPGHGLTNLFLAVESDEKARNMLAQIRSKKYRGRQTKRMARIVKLQEYSSRKLTDSDEEMKR